MHENSDPDLAALREALERHTVSGTPLEIIYFGGGLPGAKRVITPLRYCEQRGPGYLIALCHRSGIEKTFRLDRMHLPGPPVEDGSNDFRVLAKCLGSPRYLENLLAQIARLDTLPIEQALAAHFDERGEFESFFDEYPYGGYTLELTFTSSVISLSLGYEANDGELVHYEFTPENEPRLTPGIASHYDLLTGRPAPRSEAPPLPPPRPEVPRPLGPFLRAEASPGVFLEHFDLGPPLGDGCDAIIYRYLLDSARAAAEEHDWGFRSYSLADTPGTHEDWIGRQIRHFPTLILFRDGQELGRHTVVAARTGDIASWADKLLGLPEKG